MTNDEEITTLEKIPGNNHSSLEWYSAIMGSNLGSKTIKLSMSLHDFCGYSHVANQKNNEEMARFEGQPVAQRELNIPHAKKLAQYTLMGLVHAQIKKMEQEKKDIHSDVRELQKQLPSGPYTALQPITCNMRPPKCEFGGGNLTVKHLYDKNHLEAAAFLLGLGSSDILYVVDGQHRLSGFEMVVDFLRFVQKNYRYPKKGIFTPTKNLDLMSDSLRDFWQDVLGIALKESEVSIEIHLGLDTDQEQQMFVDLNQKGKRPTASYVNSFDSADPVNNYIREHLENHSNVKISEVDQSDWHNDNGSMKRKDIKTICALLIHGKTSTHGVTPAIVDKQKDFVGRFWELVSQIPNFGIEGARSKTIIHQPIVLQALAKLAFDLAHGTSPLRDQKGFDKLYSAIKNGTLNFSHDEELWRALFLNRDERNKEHKGLENFVHVPLEANLDAGTFDKINGWVRFGSRHNDIRPRIGDLIRFTLDLKPRPTVTKAIEKEMKRPDSGLFPGTR